MRRDDRRAGEGEVFEIERAEIQLYNWAGDGAGAGVAPAPFQNVEKLGEDRSADDIGHDRDGRKAHLRQGRREIARIPVQQHVRAKRRDLRVLGGGGHGDGLCPAPLCELDERPADAAGCAGDENAVARFDIGAGKHVLSRHVRGGEGRELRVGKLALDGMELLVWNLGEFGIATVEFRAEVFRLVHVGWISPVANPRVDEDSPADQTAVDALAYSFDAPTNVGALDARELDARAPGAVVALIHLAGARSAFADGFRIPASASVHIGVVQPAGENADQRLAGPNFWLGPIGVILQFVEVAMACEDEGAHPSSSRRAT
mmetsp:Transcript_1432/g.3676  ORF Transcript_1432/g.3676 Transcript_1432/m.3676 type:complete len:317 (+) Transcript_1432:361-1311(+)